MRTKSDGQVVKDRAQKMQNTMLQYSDSQKSLQDMVAARQTAFLLCFRCLNE